MSLPLIIWLPDEPRQPWPWFHGEREGIALSDADKSELGDLQTSQVRIIMAGQAIRQMSHDLPPMKENEKMAAARFAIENDIGSSLTGQHIVLGGSDDQYVSIIAHDKITSVLSHLSRANIAADGVYADFDCLAPDQPFILADRVIYPRPQGYTIDRDWVDIEGREKLLSQMTPRLTFETATNLLSGTYANTADLLVSKAAIARIAALLLITFCAWLGFEWAQARAVEQRVEMLKAETANLYTSATGTRAPVNPALEVTRALKNGGSSQSSFLDLSRLLFTSVAQTDNIVIETLQYDHQNDHLALRFIYPEFESAGVLEDAVRKNGGVFRSGGVREQNGRLIGEAILEGKP